MRRNFGKLTLVSDLQLLNAEFSMTSKRLESATDFKASLLEKAPSDTVSRFLGKWTFSKE